MVFYTYGWEGDITNVIKVKTKLKFRNQSILYKVKAKLLSEHGPVAVETRKLTQPTKKLDCPVTFTSKNFTDFQHFKLKMILSGVNLWCLRKSELY